MEVFLRELPLHLASSALQEQLKQFMVPLNITDYLVEKQRNKPTGNITFLREADGKAFLQRHGEELIPQPRVHSSRQRHSRHPPSRSRLSLMGKRVFCRLSDRKPHEYTLKTIKHEASLRSHSEATAEPPTKTLEATELNCGYHTLNDGKLTFTAEWTAAERCLVKFAKRTLTITMTRRKVQLRIPFQSIIDLVWWHNGSVAVTLSWAPTILISQSPEDDLAAAISLFSFSPGGSQKKADQSQRLQAIDKDHLPISPFCLVYRFQVPNAITRHTNSDFQSEMFRLTRQQLFHVTRDEFSFKHAIAVRFSDAAANLRGLLAQYTSTGSLPFGLLFLLQALMANGYLHPTTISALAQRLAQRFREARGVGDTKPPVSVDAFKKLFDWIDYPMVHGESAMFEVDGIMEYLEKAEILIRESSALRLRMAAGEEMQNRALIFRAVVTPTRITLHGPEPEPMNRVLRKYPDHSYFIRTQFCDENGQDLFFNAKVSLDSIYDRFKSVLSNGIQVAGRVYKLLGFSHSSLRAHSAWLSASFVHQGQVQIPDLIVTGLGDFNKIKSPARRAARIGQAFSETPWAVDLDEHLVKVERIPDVERISEVKRTKEVFSDGVGTLSQGVAQLVHDIIPKSKGFPTCFQIRWGGAKGMLAVDPRLDGNIICIRPSMEKFDSNDKQLEICDMASNPMPMVLNRQLIKILEDMGAPNKWFLDLQNNELQRLRGISSTVYNTASFLRSQRIGESIQLHKFLRQTEAMGLDYRRDNFLRGAVEAILLRELRLLKHKARIPVRNGMTLFGIMDETGLLKEGEVYVTFDPEDDRHSQPPGPGLVLVTRSPALHPGDVQTFVNTIPPDDHPLVQLRNCLVFSMWGERSPSNQLSGGDLDGDVFHIIWDPAVVDVVTTFPPASYPRVEPLELTRPVTSADMAAFFVDFMRTDHLGVIATRHMILADQREDGTLDQDCIKLAELHSSAVDFSKSGRAVELSQLPRSPKWRPDFLAPGPLITIYDKSAIAMEDYVAPQANEDEDDDDAGPRHRYYGSDKILGQLYRAVDERKIWTEDIRMTVESGRSSFWDELLAALRVRVGGIGPVEWRHRSDEAHGILHAYQDAVHGLMIDCADQPHQPLRELEVFVGFILNKNGIQTHRQRDRSVKLKDGFERIAAWITREMRNPTSMSGYTSELDALELCLACLNVGCQKKHRQMLPGHRSSPQDIESFKIVAAAALMRELATLEKGKPGLEYTYGGGYVGVSGRVGRNPDRALPGISKR
ncbi:RNA dependent RNA polymerase-domain-containing protein [Chaetomium fimeti]|uniref:RNA-dependent RNA polymerase n=1 Tax=Chaetomium fimeti TaxID=1854472 RepID=A0AAE0HKA0_9PEZI|nr:RNA dependent RNA polymerase-domain-containing protein [Chaetomium fimeti]